MTRTLSSLFLCLALLAAGAAAAERTLLQTDVPPERRAGRTFVPMRAVSEALGASVAWEPRERAVTIAREERTVVLRVGSRRALVDGGAVTLDAAPYIRDGRTMVPLRFAAEALETPVHYEARTESVLVGPVAGGTLWLLPLPSLRSGIVIHSPQPGAEVTSPLRIRGQANEFEGNVVVQLRTPEGKVLAESFGTGAMGMFGPFEVELPFPAPDAPRAARLVAFAPSPKDGRPLDTVTVPLTIRP
jgi:hypothetical protein